MAAVTPMMQQYESVKNQYKDCLLFYRLGDFYELFNDDAIIASRELELTLTGRACGNDQRAPMCGVPFHSADSYIAKLVTRGYKVAICEQMEDPATAKGIVRRDVVKIITPGTLTDSNTLDDKKNNYLGCIYYENKKTILVFADISTGEIFATKLINSGCQSVINELARYSPNELIYNPDAKKHYEKELTAKLNIYTGACDPDIFIYDNAYGIIMKELDLEDICDVCPKNENEIISAVGGVIAYLRDVQKSDLHHIVDLTVYETEQYMEIDAATRRNLEITETMRDKARRGSLLWVLDKTKTSMGARLLRRWLEKPLINPTQIINRNRGVGELLGNMIKRDEIAEVLDKVYDISRLITRISLGSATPKDMIALKLSLEQLPRLSYLISEFDSDILKEQYNNLDVLTDVHTLIDNAILDEPANNTREGNLIKDEFDTRVKEYRTAMNEGHTWLLQIQNQEREATGIKNLKVSYNKVFGYYIEVSKGQVNLVPDHYVRKQTLANGERYITQKLKEVENLIIGAEERLIKLEAHLFEEVRSSVADEIERLKKSAHVVAVVDALVSLAHVAEQNNYVMPEIDVSGSIDIRDGRHPVVEKIQKDSVFVPNDTMLDLNDNRLAIITGPNMAGKSTYMRQVAQICLMAQIGSFVPASYAKIGIVDKLFTRVGASDDLASGQSTFMVEMNEVSNILKNATENSLIIFDEIGRGTSTFDGLAIAWSVVEYVSDKKKIGAKTLFATHYHELTELEGKLDGIKNYCIAVKKRGDDITFLRKIIRGGADGSYGVEVAALAGIPKDVISRAKDILSMLEANDDKKSVGNGISYESKNSADNQIALDFGMGSEIVEELKKLDATTYTPIEALNKLYELSQKARKL